MGWSHLVNKASIQIDWWPRTLPETL